jgi:perosamine synthetase
MNKKIPIYEPWINDSDRESLMVAFDSGWISSVGENIQFFEQEFADYCGSNHGICVSNGTAALHLVLDSIGIGVGDEVLVPDLTFVATANAVSYTGAEAKPIAVNPQTLCIDPQAVIDNISSNTKAVIAVHLYGHPADMVSLRKICDDYDLFLIEDAAEAHGAEVGGQKVGSWGDAATFSFYGNKVITTGEGGMITTNNAVLSDTLRFRRDHAMSKESRYWHPERGYNYRMTNLQAAIGRSQLSRIEEILARKKIIFGLYQENLSKVETCSLNYTSPDCKNVFWLVNIRLKSSCSKSVAELAKYLSLNGIDSRPVFFPMSSLPMFQDSQKCEISWEAKKTMLSLPSGPLLTKMQVDRICKHIKLFLIKGD